MKHNYKYLFLLFCLFLILLSSLTAQSDQVHAEDDHTINLGATIPLSGDFATYGNIIKDGIELAIDDLRSEGYKVKISYEAVNYPGPQAVTAIRKLVDKNKINALVANYLNPAIPAMAPVIQQNKILSFHTATADDLILKSGDYIVSTNSTIRDESIKLAEFARNELKAKTAGVLYISTTFGADFSKHFVKRFEELGGKIVVNDTTMIGEVDLRGVLTKLKKKKPDVFFAAYFGTNLGTVVKQAKTIGLDMPILAVNEAEDTSVIDIGKSAANGMIYYLPVPSNPSENVLDFRKRFKSKYGYEPYMLTANSYDATRIAVKTLSRCKLNPECSKKEVYKIKDYDGVSGVFSIEADGGAKKELVLKTIENLQFVNYKPL